MAITLPKFFSPSTMKAARKQDSNNAAKTLLANIRFMDVDNPVRTIVITSSVPNEGKSFVSQNLARAIASSGKRVLLVECDMRRRSLASDLGVHARRGIYSVVSGRTPLEEAVVLTDTRNMYFLDAEPGIPNPSDLMSSHLFGKFIETIQTIFDYVVFDTPPVATFVDAAVLGRQADATLLVVRENFAKKDEIEAAANQLSQSGCNLAGIVMNFCEGNRSEYYASYYYRGHDDEQAPKLTPSGLFNRFSGKDDGADVTNEASVSAESVQAGHAEAGHVRATGAQRQIRASQTLRAEESAAATPPARRVDQSGVTAEPRVRRQQDDVRRMSIPEVDSE